MMVDAKKDFGSIRLVWAAGLLLLIASGCATSRGVLDVRVAVPQDPASGPAVTIARVNDLRQFEIAPRDASIPSLKNREIDNKSITLRAIARKRNGYGMAMGDIVLPEGRTVEDVVREALTRSFREAGYRVIDGDAPSREKAAPVEADIEQFWSWLTPGFWAFGMSFEAKVRIRGDIPPLQEGRTVRGFVELHTQAASAGKWLNLFNKGMDEFEQEVKKVLTSQKPGTI